MRPKSPNFSIVVNWREKGFGCAKACTYCNWRDSPLLPHGGQSKEEISSFIKKCDKPFITISGGADPLYKFEEYSPQLLAMIQTIKEHGYKARIITRELQHIAKLRGIVDYFSVSLDTDVLDALGRYQHEWDGLDIEYSLVLPPLPTADIVSLKPQYFALYRRLGRRLVLRENLNSIYPLDFDQLTFGHTGIVFVTKDLCLSGRYLSTVDCVGHDIVQDTEQLARYLMNEPRLHLFGGFVKHLLSPRVHPEYSDIDLISQTTDTMRILEDQFSYTFKDVSQSATSYPRYFLGKSERAGKTIQLILMNSSADAMKFIAAAQYDADRVSFSAGQFHFDGTVGEEVIRNAINTKQINLISDARDLSLFSINRPQVEQRHKIKLLRKGFTINN
ncbi:radical SAM protein [Rugamonas apoptosis]|uniref:Radical SAM protein n=1 Tax=Rugamonas apoptosis TaxID=2758570 RepID=A0A7W2IIY2_9BURK|nr:radical SAM protein [Rugamonas apoptosis]MBA5685924.1 radical SAM protein [Rugamonas apoptosis]